MTRRPRWLREHDRRNAVAGQVEDLHALVDRAWVDQLALLRAFGVKDSLSRRGEQGRASHEGGQR